MQITVRTYQRPDLLALTLWSLSQSLLRRGEDQVLVMHDGPPDERTRLVIEQGRLWLGCSDVGLIERHSDTHRGVQGHAKWSAEQLDPDGGEVFANVTDDCLVAPGWLCMLRHVWHQGRGAKCIGILAGYCPSWADEHSGGGEPRHTVRRQRAPVLGLLNRELWQRVLRAYEPGRRDEHGKLIAFDNALWNECQRSARLILTTKRGVIQHVGVRGVHGPMNPPLPSFIGT